MFAKESLYINAIKYKTQLKISYKKFQNNNLIETNSSTFIAKDDILSKDIVQKLWASTSQVKNSYVSSLLLNDETRLLKKSQTKLKGYAVTNLNNEYNIAVSQNTLFETKNYFSKCGIDYIFSAYHILNLHIEQNPCNNNLLILLFNNQAFCIILNKKGEVVFHKKVNLTSFEEIRDSKFYENELLEQRLYDEVYALELHYLVKNTTEEFYSTIKDTFIQKVSILSNIKFISKEQINQMAEELMLEVVYYPLSVDEELFELSKDTHVKKSFISPRKKPSSSNKGLFFAIILFVIFLGGAYEFLHLDELFDIKKPQKSVIKSKKVKNKIMLLDNVKQNNIIKTKVLKTFASIPYDVVLNELDMEESKAQMQINLLKKDTYIKVLKPELLKMYKNSDISFREDKSPILEATIKLYGSTTNKKQLKQRDYKDAYIKNEFIPIIRVTEQLKMLFPKNTGLTFKSNTNSTKITTFNYLVDIVIKKPLEFFDIIDRLNNEIYSINIAYPLSFTKTKDGIEVEFILQFHQPNAI